MPITLTVGFTIPNGMRLEFPGLVKGLDDETGVWTIKVELRTSNPNGRRPIAKTEFQVRDGACGMLQRQASPAAGLNIDDQQHYFLVTSRDVPTGFTDAWAAIRAAGNSPAARLAAAEAHLYSAGHIHSSLAGA